MRWSLFLFILGVVRTSWAGRLAFINFIATCAVQGHSEVRWRPGQEASLVLPCWKLRSFRSICSTLKKVLVTLLGLLGAPEVPRHQGIEPPLPQSRCAPAAVFYVVADTCEKPKSISSYENGCMIHATEFRFKKSQKLPWKSVDIWYPSWARKTRNSCYSWNWNTRSNTFLMDD